ncbi:cadherin-23-like [Watersipora subatra]|uniref:cadherin-23-like n=1 Tax=Watersipora subatra TaxID=2589382 RepID=UPI00355C241B
MKMKDWWLVYLLLLSSVEANNWPEYYGPSSTTISEAAPIGAEVFQFSVSDVDDDPLTVIINYNKQFNLVINSPSNYSVTLKDTIDRETMSRYDLQVTISDGTVQESVDVRIRVEDVNDFVPIIKNTQLSASVRENQPMGTFVINITTEDEDSGYNAATEIILDDETLPFYLGDPSTKEPLEHSYGRATVLIRESLDYEQQPLYSVAVTVTDMAGCVGAACQTPLSTTQTLRVTVLDEQDTPPYFTSLPYVAQTHENLPVGSKIIQILALDGDTSARRNVEYFFVTSSGEFVGRLGYFSIDPSSGEITNAEVIDADSAEVKAQASFYTLNVTAKEVLRDGEVEQPELDQSFASVSVSILDVNDERPTFSTNAISASIMEGLPAGSSVQFNDTLKVVDLDQGANGVFTLRALTEAGQVSPWFNVIPQRVINEATISLTTKDMIDYEANSTITIKIEARDLQSGTVTFKTVDIDVEDSNDNNPTFSSAVYEATVVENSVRGTVVSSNTQIIATDIDSGSYGVVFYSLETEQDVFNIDPESAEITVACDRCLDRELEPVYYLVIEAIDGGGLLDTAQLTITVTDVNDHAPQFTADVYEASVNENTLQFVTPLNVQANDADEGSNAIVSYSLLNYTDHFDINSNGSVFITQALDAEAVSDVLEVTVSARDMGTPALNSTAVIRVQILDMNDKTPQFGQSSPFRNVSEDATIGTIIYTAHATDDDRSSPNKDIIYSLLYGGFHQFRIEPQTGHIRVNSSLDRESSRNEYSLVVRASDRGQPPLSSQQTIVVKVTDVNDEAPVFLQNDYAFEIEEGQDANTPVGTVQATDPDTNKIIKYNITETKAFSSDDTAVELQNDPFSINYSTGLLLVSSVLDRETVSRVELTVTAQDVNGLQPQISTVKVKIEIIDVNDNPPVIQPVGILEVEEGDYSASEPRLVTQLTVIDQDLDSRFDYSLSLNPFSVYSINDNGEVYLISSIDRENVGSWLNFTAVVQDGTLSSSLDVAVKVMDVNDNTPQFVEFADELVVPETARLGLILTRVRAVDTDSDAVNRQIKYSITSGSLNRVTINETTGLVTVSGDLDRDAQQIPNNRLSLIIKACDTGDPMLCQSKAMTIRIT